MLSSLFFRSPSIQSSRSLASHQDIHHYHHQHLFLSLPSISLFGSSPLSLAKNDGIRGISPFPKIHVGKTGKTKYPPRTKEQKRKIQEYWTKSVPDFLNPKTTNKDISDLFVKEITRQGKPTYYRRIPKTHRLRDGSVLEQYVVFKRDEINLTMPVNPLLQRRKAVRKPSKRQSEEHLHQTIRVQHLYFSVADETHHHICYPNEVKSRVAAELVTITDPTIVPRYSQTLVELLKNLFLSKQAGYQPILPRLFSQMNPKIWLRAFYLTNFEQGKLKSHPVEDHQKLTDPLFLSIDLHRQEELLIPASLCQFPPKIDFIVPSSSSLPASSSSPPVFHTLALVDVDDPTPETAYFPRLHWLLTNIPSNEVEKGETVAHYVQPLPAFGSSLHRLVFVLFEQKTNIETNLIKEKFDALEARANFDMQSFVEQNDLTAIGLTMFNSEYDESVKNFYPPNEEPIYVLEDDLKARQNKLIQILPSRYLFGVTAFTARPQLNKVIAPKLHR